MNRTTENQNRPGEAGEYPQARRAPGAGPMAAALTFGYQVAGGMAVFSGIGYLLDRKFRDDYLFTLLGVFVGFAYVLYEAWKLIQTVNPSEANQNTDADHRT